MTLFVCKRSSRPVRFSIILNISLRRDRTRSSYPKVLPRKILARHSKISDGSDNISKRCVIKSCETRNERVDTVFTLGYIDSKRPVSIHSNRRTLLINPKSAQSSLNSIAGESTRPLKRASSYSKSRFNFQNFHRVYG